MACHWVFFSILAFLINIWEMNLSNFFKSSFFQSRQSSWHDLWRNHTMCISTTRRRRRSWERSEREQRKRMERGGRNHTPIQVWASHANWSSVTESRRMFWRDWWTCGEMRLGRQSHRSRRWDSVVPDDPVRLTSTWRHVTGLACASPISRVNAHDATPS
jgi:hypothetical protein